MEQLKLCSARPELIKYFFTTIKNRTLFTDNPTLLIILTSTKELKKLSEILNCYCDPSYKLLIFYLSQDIYYEMSNRDDVMPIQLTKELYEMCTNKKNIDIEFITISTLFSDEKVVKELWEKILLSKTKEHDLVDYVRNQHLSCMIGQLFFDHRFFDMKDDNNILFIDEPKNFNIYFDEPYHDTFVPTLIFS